MKNIVAIAFACLLLVSDVSLAQEAKSFSEMTLEELQDINKKSLSKTDRKLYKKALKAAKKADKAWIKAEKKAAKAKQKIEQQKQKYLEARKYFFTRTFDETKIYRDDFKTTVGIKGAEHYVEAHSRKLFSAQSRFRDSCLLLAFYDKETAEVRFQLQLIHKFIDLLPDREQQNPNFSPGRYADDYGVWKNFNTARLRGGKELEIHLHTRLFPAECDSSCGFTEPVSAIIPKEVLLKNIDQRTVLSVKFYSQKGHSIVVKLHQDYLMAFFMKLAEVDEEKLAYYGNLAADHMAKLDAALEIPTREIK